MKDTEQEESKRRSNVSFRILCTAFSFFISLEVQAKIALVFPYSVAFPVPCGIRGAFVFEVAAGSSLRLD